MSFAIVDTGTAIVFSSIRWSFRIPHTYNTRIDLLCMVYKHYAVEWNHEVVFHHIQNA